MHQFQLVYLDEHVSDLLDQHPGMRRQNAMPLRTEPWLDDLAA